MATSQPNFDLTYRPDYWRPSDPVSLIIANVKGEERRRMILDVLEQRHELTPAGADLPEELLQDTLTYDDRVAWGRLHPTFMGGEYLPDYGRGEIEIARIVLASTTTDVTSVRARRTRDLRIHYRVVDEYEATFVHHPLSSKAPLDFAQLISLLDSIRDATDAPGHEVITWCRDGNYASDPGDPAAYAHFVTVESAFYPQLEAYYRWRNERWLAHELAALAAKAGRTKAAGRPDAGEEAAR